MRMKFKAFQYVFICLFYVFIQQINAETILDGGNVSGIWNKEGSPYLINGELLVPAGETLNIDPGVTVMFMDNFRLSVVGNLIAKGTQADSIFFTVPDSTLSDISDIKGWHGLRFFEQQSISDSAIVEYCHFSYGRSLGSGVNGYGGSILVAARQNVRISHSVFTNNEAIYGGAIACTNNARIKLSQNSFLHNQASYTGAAIYGHSSEIDLRYVSILFNKSQSNGGGIAFYNGNYSLKRCILLGNEASNGGAVYLRNVNNVEINNSTICNNSASFGKGISSSYSTITIRGSIIKNETYRSEFDDFYQNYGLDTAFCFFGDPKLVDSELGDARLSWENYPENDLSKSLCIDGGDPNASLDPDGTIQDIGAIPFEQGSEAPPKASFAVDTVMGIIPFVVKFSNLSTQADGSIQLFNWAFGDGYFSTEESPSHTFKEGGVYDVSLKVANQDGKKDSVVKSNLITVLGGTFVNESEVYGTWTKENSPYNIYTDIFICL